MAEGREDQMGDGNGRPPHSSPTRPVVAATRRTRATHSVAEIIAEGDEARLKLAHKTALQVLDDPSVLTTKRINLLGPDGVAALLAHIRAVLQPAAPAAISADIPGRADSGRPPTQALPGSSKASSTPAPVRQRSAAGWQRASFAGWWQASQNERPSSSAQARHWGYAIAASLAALALALLARSPF